MKPRDVLAKALKDLADEHGIVVRELRAQWIMDQRVNGQAHAFLHTISIDADVIADKQDEPR